MPAQLFHSAQPALQTLIVERYDAAARMHIATTRQYGFRRPFYCNYVLAIAIVYGRHTLAFRVKRVLMHLRCLAEQFLAPNTAL